MTADRKERPTHPLVLVGRIGPPHGLNGAVRITSFTSEPSAIADYGPLTNESGTRAFVCLALHPLRDGVFVARFKGVDDRRTAESLANTNLYVSREQFPPRGAEEFLYADLIGLKAETRQGIPVGTVVAVQNFGAGDVLEIAPPAGETLLLAFTRANVPLIDLTNGRLIVDLPREV